MKLSHDLWGHTRWWFTVERSDRTWSTGEGNGKPLQYSCLENSMNSMKRQNDRILKEEFPKARSGGREEQPHVQGVVAARAQEGLE